MAIIWITGFSGSGKTTVAKRLQKELKNNCILSVLLDGDELRGALDLTKQYSYEERKKIAYKYANLSKLISDQGIIVIVATISMFEEVRQWNRNANSNYIEIYLKTSKEERLKRDSKKLYASQALDMASENSVYEEPQNPDLVFDHIHQLSTECIVERILETFYKMEN
jgi:adenylylsulfate kinase